MAFFTNLGYIDPNTGAQVAFPYSDRYGEWAIVNSFINSPNSLSRAELIILNDLILTQDQLLIDAYRNRGLSAPTKKVSSAYYTNQYPDLYPELAIQAIQQGIEPEPLASIGGGGGFATFGAVSPVLIKDDGTREVQTVIIDGIVLPDADSVGIAPVTEVGDNVPIRVDDNFTTTSANAILTDVPKLIILGIAGYGLYEFFSRRKN